MIRCGPRLFDSSTRMKVKQAQFHQAKIESRRVFYSALTLTHFQRISDKLSSYRYVGQATAWACARIKVYRNRFDHVFFFFFIAGTQFLFTYLLETRTCFIRCADDPMENYRHTLFHEIIHLDTKFSTPTRGRRWHAAFGAKKKS